MKAWQDDVYVSGASLVGFVQIYSDRTAKKVRAKALLAYSVPVVL